jgi:hypothetical protein
MRRSMFLISILLLLPAGARASTGLTDFRFTLDFPAPASPGSLMDYWETGGGLALGAKIPFSVWKEYQETWFEFGYYDFYFKKTPDYAIDYPYWGQVSYWGKDVRVLMPSLNALIYLRHESKKRNSYLTFGIGYMSRSRTKIRSTSPDLPYIERNYKSAGAYSFGAGFVFIIKGHAYMFTEIDYVSGNTLPDKTSFVPIKIGLLLR